ncbi:acyl-CoA dehydrogenase family protein [Salinibacterium sp. ZJ454]|uniref:acyl-CoA dehydrogenase family protein n=1 Tax=Salinibacterium sp. ZJ454 TaxID=2708339 RepID=UPI00141E58AC|nr:acyl-CoA dehydrogenase family protein [Salinibacterium sp. ZJ454]
MTMTEGFHVKTRPDFVAWLTEHAAELADLNPRPDDELETRVDKSLALLGRLHADGIIGWGWAEDLGGFGGDATDRAALYDALTATGFGMPEQVGALEVLGSALTTFAPELARRALPAVFEGRELWCQGFSEPEAGSDLASLRTTAKQTSDGWVIDGQKVWTSLGHRSRWCGVLARTGAPEGRHRTLTLFWVDLESPGVTVRPLQTTTGEAEFSEVFFDAVSVPADHVIGEVDGGWKVAMHLLQYERGMWAWQRQAIMHASLDDLIAKAGSHPAAAETVGAAYVALAALRARSRQTVERLARGERLGPEVSIDKTLLSSAEHLVNDAVRALRLNDFLFGDDADANRIRGEWYYSRAASVYGGAVEVQKNIIAEHVLGLPREDRRG